MKRTQVKKRPVEKILDLLNKFGLPDMLLARLAGVFFLVSGFNILRLRNAQTDMFEMWKEFVGNVSPVGTFACMALGFVLLSIFHYTASEKFRIADTIALFSGVMLFALAVVWRSDDFYLCIGISAVAVVFIGYMMGKLDHDRFEKLPTMASAIIVAAVTLVVLIFVCVTSIGRHRTFVTTGFDFGIFVQMFHSLADTFTAVITCERETFLSHFNVHASYIFYFLTPFYAIFPNENTLLIMQAVLAMGGVIPLFLMAQKHKFSGFPLIAVCMTYIFCTGLLAPCYYDFHENALLPTLLMWLLYAVDQRKYVLLYIMSVLVCIVKEDAPLYVMCIAMYFFFDEKSKKRLHGLLVTGLSFIYFVIITNWLAEHGDGHMMARTRLGILTIDADAGFAGIAENVLLHPGYFFSLLVKEETLLFFLQTMIPLLFLPLMTKKIHRFLLIVPYVIMNLVIGAGYTYAANIEYQYIFGPACLLIYMAFINCADQEREKRNTMATLCAVLSVISAVTLISDNLKFAETYQERKDYYKRLEACLDTVPQDAAVIANTWFVPHLADRKEIYNFDVKDLVYDEQQNVIEVTNLEYYDFYVLSRRDENTNYVVPFLEEAGYRIYSETDNFIVIYVSPDYTFQN